VDYFKTNHPNFWFRDKLLKVKNSTNDESHHQDENKPKESKIDFSNSVLVDEADVAIQKKIFIAPFTRSETRTTM